MKEIIQYAGIVIISALVGIAAMFIAHAMHWNDFRVGYVTGMSSTVTYSILRDIIEAEKSLP